MELNVPYVAQDQRSSHHRAVLTRQSHPRIGVGVGEMMISK
jgi:hypothetical protein